MKALTVRHHSVLLFGFSLRILVAALYFLSAREAKFHPKKKKKKRRAMIE
jgi:hypothetical protein